MKPGKIDFHKKNERGRADVDLRPSHPLGIFVVKISYFGGYRPPETVITRKIRLEDVKNKDAKRFKTDDETVLSEYAKPSQKTPGKFKIRAEASARVDHSWEDLDSQTVFEYLPAVSVTPELLDTSDVQAQDTAEVVDNATS